MSLMAATSQPSGSSGLWAGGRAARVALRAAERGSQRAPDCRGARTRCSRSGRSPRESTRRQCLRGGGRWGAHSRKRSCGGRQWELAWAQSLQQQLGVAQGCACCLLACVCQSHRRRWRGHSARRPLLPGLWPRLPGGPAAAGAAPPAASWWALTSCPQTHTTCSAGRGDAQERRFTAGWTWQALQWSRSGAPPCCTACAACMKQLSDPRLHCFGLLDLSGNPARMLLFHAETNMGGQRCRRHQRSKGYDTTATCLP